MTKGPGGCGMEHSEEVVEDSSGGPRARGKKEKSSEGTESD